MTESRTDPLGGWTTVPADTLPVNFSTHARERFAERLRSGSSDAVDELSRMLASAIVTTKRPGWFGDSEERAAAYLLLGEDVVLPLVARANGELVATTLITRGSMGEEKRQRRTSGAPGGAPGGA